MTILGVVFALAAALVLAFRPRSFPWLLAASAAFPASSALNVAGNSLSPFYAMGAIAAVLLLLDSRKSAAGPGSLALQIFVAWSILITVAGPLVFSGIRILSSRTGVDLAILAPEKLEFTVSTMAQVFYLMIAVCAVAYLAREKSSPLLAALPLALGTGISTLCAIFNMLHLPWPGEIFDTNLTLIYADTWFGPESRLRGIFAEPSELAGFSMASAGFFALAMATTTGRRRILSIVMFGCSVLNLNLSSSGTAVIAVVVFVAVAAGVGIIRYVRNGCKGLEILTLSVLALTLLSFVFGDEILNRGQELFVEKLDSQSFNARSTADLFSLKLFLETLGLGVGLGGNRPSSFVTMLLSCVGLIGTLSFLAFLGRTTAAALSHRNFHPAIWALIGLIISKIVGLPDLSTPMLWVLAGSIAGATWNIRTASPSKRLIRL